MDFQPLIKAVEHIAPTLAGAIVGPAGSVVVNLIESALGISDQTPAQLANTIATSDDAKQKILGLQYAHQEALETLAVNDRASARQRDLAIITAGHTDWIVPLIAIFVTVGFFAVVGMIAYSKLDAMDHDLLNILCGVLGTAWVSIINFYFGASHQKMDMKK